ncbi:MAG: prenyltransferase [Candidatus Sumerlaeota bacterium]
MQKFATILAPMRIPFLILAPVCVFLGIASASAVTSSLSPFFIILVLLGGLAGHIGVNALNEYWDARTGLDAMTTRTPFSGGSGIWNEHPDKIHHALYVGLTAAALTVLIGLFFAFAQGPQILLIGIIGLVAVLAYTPWIVKQPLICLIAPGLGFGPVMVVGTTYALTGQWSATAAVASLVPFFLVSNLLLLNQFPDKTPDAKVGRRHVVILLGRRHAAVIYTLFLALTYLTILAGVAFNLLPEMALLGLLTLVLAIPAGLIALRKSDDIQGLHPALAMNVLINLLTPVLMGIGLLIG